MTKKVIDFNRLPKQEYLKPAMEVNDLDLHVQILAGSVQTTGLDGEDLTEDKTPGDAWNDAMSRRRNGVWDDEEED